MYNKGMNREDKYTFMCIHRSAHARTHTYVHTIFKSTTIDSMVINTNELVQFVKILSA